MTSLLWLRLARFGIPPIVAMAPKNVHVRQIVQLSDSIVLPVRICFAYYMFPVSFDFLTCFYIIVHIYIEYL